MAPAVGRTLAKTARPLQPRLFFGIATAVLMAAALVPLLFVAWDLIDAGAPALRTLGSARPWVLFAKSIGIAAAVTMATVVIGVPLGVVFARVAVPLRRIAFAAHAMVMFLPPLLPALGWFHLFGAQGMIGSDATASILFSPAGLIVILTLTFAPVVTSLTALGVLSVDPSLEEAARTVARPFRVVCRILVPAALPAVLLGALVVFSLALSEVGVPMFLRTVVYPAAVFARLGGIDYAPGEAAALSLPLIAVALALLAVERRGMGRRSFAVLGLRDAAHSPFDAGRWTMPLGLACLVAAILSILPVGALVLRAGRGGGFSNALDWIGASAYTSAAAAGISATAITLLAIVLGHGLARRFPGASFSDTIALLAFFVPSVILGAGMITAWNRPSTQLVYRSMAVMILAFVARYAIVGIRVLAVAVTQSPPSYEEAAMIGGAGYARRLFRIVVPMHKRAVLAAWLFAAVFCLRDLETVVPFYPPGSETLTVRIFTLEANGPPATVAALATIQVAMTALMLLAAGALLRGGGRS